MPDPSSSSDVKMDEEVLERFECELLWCIRQLENTLTNGKLNAKQAEHARRTLRTLQSPTAIYLKKRQAMNLYFGNYRKKMEDEAEKIRKANAAVKIKEVAPSGKSVFLQKSVSKLNEEERKSIEKDPSNFKFQKSDNTFRFDF